MAKAFLYMGTSGWYYDHWDGVFYPNEIKSPARLNYYASTFNTVEVNSTFYHTPKESVVKQWAKQVPVGFIFSVKASGYITHRKRLNDCEESISFFFKRIKHLKKHLGPILFQLPPSFKKNLDRLIEFVQHLESSYRYVFEFRHSSWYEKDVYDLLKKNDIALCITDLGGKLSPCVTTTDFSYLRLHGPKKAYQGSYGTRKLKEWKERILGFLKDKISVYCYFDNDEKAFAIKDAQELKSLILKPKLRAAA